MTTTLGMMTLTLRSTGEVDLPAAAATIRELPRVVRVRCQPEILTLEITYREPSATLLRDVHHALRRASARQSLGV
jgi:hypothetical protein